MIDFYKFNFLSELGQDAGNMNEIDYQKRIVDTYRKYMIKLKKIKRDKNKGE